MTGGLHLKYGLVFFASAAALFAERFWNAFWPALSVLAFFAGCATLNLLTAFGPGVHLALLMAFAALFSYASVGLGTAFRAPRTREIRRAIEISSELSHRPFETLLDAPLAGTPPEARKLWEKYQQRLIKLRDRAQPYRPRPAAGRADPYGLRIAAAVLLVFGLLVAQGDAWFRIRQSLRVDVTHWAQGKPVQLDAWITPPDYTAANPVFLATTAVGAAPAPGPVTVPEGSLLKIRLAGVEAAPAVTYTTTGADKDKNISVSVPAFTEPAPHSFTMEMPLNASGTLAITKGWFGKLGTWAVTIKPDLPPEITLLGTEKGERAGLKIKYHAADDYGVRKIFGGITPVKPVDATTSGNSIDFDIPLPEDPKKDEQVYTADLASHPLAGSEVMLTLSATDAAGHTTSTQPQKIVLPERAFTNPVAQRIIAERKRLIQYDNLLTERLVMTALTEIADTPVNYKGDLLVFLGLDMAGKRLADDGGPEAVQSDIALLWDLAVRVEDGGLSLASRELSDALQKLSEGLKDKSLTKDQIQDLMDKVRQKMREYVQTLSAEMRQRMQEGKQSPQLSPELAEKLMKHIDLDKLMEQMKQLNQGSEREQMEKMAEFLKQTVDNFDPEKFDKMQEAQKKAMDALNKLQKLIERQQSLLDHTNKMQEQKQPEQTDQPPQKGQPQGENQPQGQPQGQPEQQEQQQAGSQGQEQGQGQQQSTGGESPQPQTGEQQGAQGQAQAAGKQGQQQPSGQQQGQSQNSGLPQQGPPGAPGPTGTSGPTGTPGQTGQQDQHLAGKTPGQNPAGQGSGPGSKPGPQGQPSAGDHGGPQPAPGGTQGSQQAGAQPGQGQAGQGQAAGGAEGDGKFPQPKTPQQGASEQGAIRDKLGDMLRDIASAMPSVPDGFTKADQAMKAAQKALKDGDPRGSAPAQKEALDNLQKAEDQALEQMAKSLQAMLSMGMGQGGGPGGFGEGYDPLGRGKNSDENIKLPDEKERRRVQQIIEELRSRSNDYQRPKVERDYIDRLLEQFE